MVDLLQLKLPISLPLHIYPPPLCTYLLIRRICLPIADISWQISHDILLLFTHSISWSVSGIPGQLVAASLAYSRYLVWLLFFNEFGLLSFSYVFLWFVLDCWRRAEQLFGLVNLTYISRYCRFSLRHYSLDCYFLSGVGYDFLSILLYGWESTWFDDTLWFLWVSAVLVHLVLHFLLLLDAYHLFIMAYGHRWFRNRRPGLIIDVRSCLIIKVRFSKSILWAWYDGLYFFEGRSWHWRFFLW